MQILDLPDYLYDQPKYGDPDYAPPERWREVSEWCEGHQDRYRLIHVPSDDQLDNRNMTLVGHGPTMAIPRGQDMVRLTQLVHDRMGLGIEPNMKEALNLAREAGGLGGVSTKVVREIRIFQKSPTQDSAFWQILTEAAVHGVVDESEVRPMWLIASRMQPTGFLVELIGPDTASSKGFHSISTDPSDLFELDLSSLRLPAQWTPWGWGSTGSNPLTGGNVLDALSCVAPRLHRLIDDGVLLFERRFEFLVLTDAKERGDLGLALVRNDLREAFLRWAGGRASESEFEGWTFVERFDAERPLPAEGPIQAVRCLGAAVPRTKRGWLRGGLELVGSGAEDMPRFLGNGYKMPELVLQVPSTVFWLGKEMDSQTGIWSLTTPDGIEGPWESELTVTAKGETEPFIEKRRLYFDTEPSGIQLAKLAATRFTGSTVYGQRPYGQGAGFPMRPAEGELDEFDELFRPVMYLGRNPGQWVEAEEQATWRLFWEEEARTWRARFLPLGAGCGQNPCLCPDRVIQAAWEAGNPLQFGSEKQKSRWRSVLCRSVRYGGHPCTYRLFQMHRKELLQGRRPKADPPFPAFEASKLLPTQPLKPGWEFTLWDGADQRTRQLRKLTSTLLAMTRKMAFVSYDDWDQASRFAGVDEGHQDELQRSLEEVGFLDKVRMMNRPFLWGVRILPPSLAGFREGGAQYWVSYGAWLPGQCKRFFDALTEGARALELTALGIHARESLDPWIPPGFRIHVPDPDITRTNVVRSAASAAGVIVTHLDKVGLLNWATPEIPPCWDDPGATVPSVPQGPKPMGDLADGLRVFRWMDGKSIKCFGSADLQDWSYDLRRTMGLMARRSGIECFRPIGDLDVLVRPWYHLPVPLARAAAILGPCLPFPAQAEPGSIYRFPTKSLRDAALQTANQSLSPLGVSPCTTQSVLTSAW